ncbi:MAG: hypothetical protein ACTS73_00880 [Arsenophonus sp. NEOnobi-MAG3]
MNVKEVVVTMTLKEAKNAVHGMLACKPFGQAPHHIVIDEFLDG